MKLIEKLIDIVIVIVRLLYRYRTLNLLKSIFRRLYTIWISHEFAHCGRNCRIDFLDYLVGGKKMSLGDGVVIGKNTVMELYDSYGNAHFDARLTIGDNTKIGPYSHLSCVNEIRIGNDVLTGRRVLITDNSHGSSAREMLDMNPDLREVVSKGPVVIEDFVWIGEGACILPGVTIGKGSIIGANAVVTKDIPPYSVAGGNPARVIKSL